MYQWLVIPKSTAQPKVVSRQQRYGLQNKVHHAIIMGVSGDDGPEYYGPPRPGQSFAQYESLMSLPIAVGASGAMIGAMVAGPIGAIVGGVGSWLVSGGSSHRSKPKTQGG